MNPFKVLKLIRRLSKLLVKAKSITTGQNVTGQVIGLMISAIALFTDFLPAEWQAVAVATGVLLQAVVALLAQGSNPDGTNVIEPYQE